MGNNVGAAIQELRRAFVELKPLFDERLGERYIYDPKANKWIDAVTPSVNLPMPIITIQSRGRKQVDGWYKPSAWDNPAADALNTIANMGTGTKVHAASTDEICLAAEAMDKSSEEILTILTHQMIHHYARHNNKAATQNGNGYHSQKFVGLANHIGLEVERDGSRGWCLTKPSGGTYGHQLTERFSQINLDRNAFDMHRKGLGNTEFKGSKLKKWSCKCTNIRSAVYIEATCQICKEDFVYTDKDKDSTAVIDWLNNQEKHLNMVQARNNGVRKPHWRNSK